MVGVGLEPATFQIQHPNHSAMLLFSKNYICNINSKSNTFIKTLESASFVSQELELLPAKELQNNVYIKHSVSLEQVSIIYMCCVENVL